MALQDALIQAARRHPGREALVAGGQRLGYGELLARAAGLARVLQAGGLEPGGRVGLFLDNVWQLPVAMFGVWLAGGVTVAINAQTRRDKLGFMLRDSGARWLLSEQSLAPTFMPVVESLGLSVLSTGEVPGAGSLDDALAAEAGPVPVAGGEPNALAALIYTSGTTGDPKGVMHTHASLGFAMDSIQAYLGFRPDDRLFCALPMTFGYGLCQWLCAVRAGATLVLERSFTYPVQVFQVMQREAITSFPGVPTLYALLLAHDAKQPLCFPSVRIATNAAAALPREFIDGIRRIFPAAGLYKMYGQTECIRISYLPPEQAALKPDSVGRAIPGTSLLLLDERGQPVAPGETGTLHVRGPHLMSGYWGQPEKTAEVLLPAPDGDGLMLRTGDQFRLDADGDLFFVARSDEIIKSRGEKVSPVEVENAIYRLDGVREVVVLGVPDEVLGQAVCAVVVPREGVELNERQVKRVCSEQLENYMMPSRILFMDALPRTPNGKLSRKLLLDTLGERLTARGQ